MFTVNHYFYDSYGALRSGRWTMRHYKTERAAMNKANSIKGGYICKLGSNTVHCVGEWLL